MKNRKQKIVTIGGGTGSFTVLLGLKKLPVEITAIVSMADDGGSTGVLRDELGVLPPGDIRQCLVALSKSSETMRELFNYRYNSGGLIGHSFGNIFLSTLEKVTDSFSDAITEAGKLLNIRGKVVPVTLTRVDLIAKLISGKILLGENRIDESDLSNLKKIYLKPKARANPEAIKAIRQADKIIINPGSLYTSIIPSFLVEDIPQAIIKSKAKKIYICNLINKVGQTNDFTVLDFLSKIEEYLSINSIDWVVYNKKRPDRSLLKKYSNEGKFVEFGNIEDSRKAKFIGANFLSAKTYKQKRNDKIKRTLIRHDSDKIAKVIYKIV